MIAEAVQQVFTAVLGRTEAVQQVFPAVLGLAEAVQQVLPAVLGLTLLAVRLPIHEWLGRDVTILRTF